MATRYRAPKMPSRAEDGGYSKSSASRSGGIRWSDNFAGLKHNMDKLELATIESVGERMKGIGHAMLEDARNKTYAEKQWVDHPGRHGGASAVIGKNGRSTDSDGRWPHNLTAKQGMFSYITKRKSFIEVALAHDKDTIYITSDGENFNYGIQLETGWGGKYAVIMPTMQNWYPRVMDACVGAMVASQAQIKRKSAGGKGNINSAWLDRGKGGT